MANDNETIANIVAAMREALKRCEAISYFPEILEQQCVKDMRNIIAHALAAPPRNCDVGTAEEQEKRFYAFCLGNGRRNGGVCDKTCPCYACECLCTFTWAQMPYKDGGAE